MLVEDQGTPRRCLLARHKGSAAGSYSTLAGFVGVSESLEDAVRREVAEETGVPVGRVTYMASQGWPFPSGLMVGFRATALAETVRVDGEEVIEARWFSRADLAGYAAAGGRLGREDSIDRYLLHSGWARPADTRPPRWPVGADCQTGPPSLWITPAKLSTGPHVPDRASASPARLRHGTNAHRG
jgi:NAD+ diphosphatase